MDVTTSFRSLSMHQAATSSSIFSNTKGFKAARYPWTSSKQFKTCQVLSSVQLKERVESNITSRNMHCITQISRLLFTLKAPLKNKHQQTWRASRTNNQTKNTCGSRSEGLFKVVIGLKTRCGTYG